MKMRNFIKKSNNTINILTLICFLYFCQFCINENPSDNRTDNNGQLEKKPESFKQNYQNKNPFNNGSNNNKQLSQESGKLYENENPEVIENQTPITSNINPIEIDNNTNIEEISGTTQQEGNKDKPKPKPKPKPYNIIEGNNGIVAQGNRYIFHKIGKKNKLGHLIMGKAWNELIKYNNKKNKEKKLPNVNKLKLAGDKNVNNLVEILNKQTDLEINENYYYANAGTKEEDIVATVNKEVRKKFPSKTLDDLREDILGRPTDILAYAYFLVDMKFPKVFDTKPIIFNGTEVKGITSRGAFPSIKVLEDTRNTEESNKEKELNFLLKLNSKNKDFHVIVGKGSDYSTPEKMKNRINEIRKKDPNLIGNDVESKSRFHMPKLNFFIKNATYSPLIKKDFVDSGFLSGDVGVSPGYFILKMFDNIKFELNESGVKAEIESVIVCRAKCAAPRPSNNYILDSEFYLAIVDSKSLEIVLYLYVIDYEGFMMKV